MELPRVLLALAGMGAATGLALLPYVPRVPPGALLGKVTATTFALERPCCVFDRLANTSDAVWLVVAFANASATFRNPPSRADVPLYEGLPTAHAYMTLETAAAAYACSAPGPTVLRVGGDTACGGQHGQAACNGPLPSPGPYRVKFLVMDCHGPKAETRWSDPILLRRGTGGSGAGAASPSPCIPWGAASPLCHHPKPQRGEEVPKLSCSPYFRVPPILPLCPSPRAHPARSPSTVDPTPVRRSSDVVVIASILASLGAGLAVAALGAMGAEVWRLLCRRDFGTAFTQRSYRTHHISPALPQPPCCGCCRSAKSCSAPRPRGPCAAE
nr:uncharacterized protein LOC125183250 isoform X1 [Anser cygnoides]